MRFAEKDWFTVAKNRIAQRLRVVRTAISNVLLWRLIEIFTEDGSVRNATLWRCQALNLPPEHKYWALYGSHPDVAHCRGRRKPTSALFNFVREALPVLMMPYIQLLVGELPILIIGKQAMLTPKNISFYIEPIGFTWLHFTTSFDCLWTQWISLNN